MSARIAGADTQAAQIRERASLKSAELRVENGLVVPSDTRLAQLGRLVELPSLGECLEAWRQRIVDDVCIDYEVPFSNLSLTPAGMISKGKGGLPLTYRTFGNILRSWCAPPRNVARVLVELPAHYDQPHSPRACAFNAYLQRNPNQAEKIHLRSRLLNVPGGEHLQRRTVIAAVSASHSRADGDDLPLISALTFAFSGSMTAARASAWRGIDETEMRSVFPALEVDVPSAGPEKWQGYVVARNSETGAKSWSISAGLYRTTDGATVACEAAVRFGRHSGKKVSERMVEAADGASSLLKLLAERAGELAAKVTPWGEEETLKKIRQALVGTFAHEEDACAAIALGLGAVDGPMTIGKLMNVLGWVGSQAKSRTEARPLEILLGRVLVHGWRELKAVGADEEGGEE